MTVSLLCLVSKDAEIIWTLHKILNMMKNLQSFIICELLKICADQSLSSIILWMSCEQPLLSDQKRLTKVSVYLKNLSQAFFYRESLTDMMICSLSDSWSLSALNTVSVSSDCCWIRIQLCLQRSLLLCQSEM